MFKQALKVKKFTDNLRDYKSSKSQKAANFLVNYMGQERGLFLKIGQFLGAKDTDLSSLLHTIESDSHPLSISEFQNNLTQIAPSKLKSELKTLGPQFKSASLAQISQAELLSGPHVAIKLQIPGIKHEIEQQLKLLKIIGPMERFSPTSKWGFPVDDYLKSFKQNMELELNYIEEGKSLNRFCEIFSREKFISPPQFFPTLSNEQVLTMEWLDGFSFDEFRSSASAEEKFSLANHLAKYFFRSFIHYGFTNLDHHKNNFLISKQDGGVHLHPIDFGSSHQFSDEFRFAVCRFIIDTQQGRDATPLSYFLAMGFDKEKLKHIEDTLVPLTQIILSPFLSDYPFDLANWKVQEGVDKILGDFKWWFRASGSQEFFKLIKSFIGITQLVQSLGISLRWKQIFNKEVIQVFPQISSFSLPHVNSNYKLSTIAEKLKVRLIKEDVEKVSLSLPASALLNLEDIMDVETKEKLIRKGISIDSIIKDAAAQGFSPQELFRIVDPNTDLKIWLE